MELTKENVKIVEMLRDSKGYIDGHNGEVVNFSDEEIPNFMSSYKVRAVIVFQDCRGDQHVCPMMTNVPFCLNPIIDTGKEMAMLSCCSVGPVVDTRGTNDLYIAFEFIKNGVPVYGEQKPLGFIKMV